MLQTQKNNRRRRASRSAVAFSFAASSQGKHIVNKGLAYYILTRTLIRLHGNDSLIATALGNRLKEITSLAAYALAILLVFVNPAFSLALYVLVACIWLIPDPRVERTLGSLEPPP